MFAASKTSTASSGYQISRSLRFNSADSAYLNRTPASAGNQRTWTISFWIKKTVNGASYTNIFGAASSASNRADILWHPSDYLRYYDYANTYNWFAANSAGSSTWNLYRDVSAWYHVVIAVDTTQTNNVDRVKGYINGSFVPNGSTDTYTQNAQTPVNSVIAHTLGAHAIYGQYMNGYLTEVNFIDGQQLAASSFGQTDAQTGVWTPIAYSGSYGTNGFYLNFSDNSNTTAATLGKDYSGNGNNWTPNNFSVTAGAGNDSLVDSPTSYGTDTGVGGEVRGNYATLNPLSKGGQITLSNGNLDYSHLGDTADCRVLSTIAMTSGKWYCEHTCTTTSTLFAVGIALASESPNAGYIGATSGSYGYYAFNGAKYNNGSSSAYGASWGTSGDVIGIAFDADAGTLTFYKNGTSQGTAFTSIPAGQYVFGQGDYTGTTYTGTFNFGQRPFAYTAPSGYKALCTQNLPTPTIGATSTTLAGKYFNPVLWTGNGASSRAITGVGFQPDWVWDKMRSGAYQHAIVDSVRGGNKVLHSNSTSSEDTNWQYGYVSSFDSDGFTIQAGSTSSENWNLNGSTFVAWCWKANGSGSTNTAGSITSTVSANTTSGFSVVTYTGTGTTGTIGHGLGVAPSMIIVKCRSNATTNWYTYHISIGNTGALALNLTDATITSSAFWNNTSPTSSVFTISGSSGELNGSGRTYVAYAFAEVAGYSKFGSYTGNGSTDGPFVYCGFRPRWLLIKSSTDATNGEWILIDTVRSTYNANGDLLKANRSDAEVSYTNYIDILSNGFKLRNNISGSWTNVSGATYIFAAFAESPQKFSLAR